MKGAEPLHKRNVEFEECEDKCYLSSMKGAKSAPTVEAILSLFLVGTPPPAKAIHPKPI